MRRRRLCGGFVFEHVQKPRDMRFVLLALFDLFGFGDVVHKLRQRLQAVGQHLRSEIVLRNGLFDQLPVGLHVDLYDVGFGRFVLFVFETQRLLLFEQRLRNV